MGHEEEKEYDPTMSRDPAEGPRREADEPQESGAAVPGAAKPEIEEKGGDVVEAVRKRGRGLLDRQKEVAVEELHAVADVMRDAARRFVERKEEGFADYAQKAADYVDRVSSALRERELEDLLRGAREFARRQPAVFIGGALLAGFIAGRVFRSSSQRVARRRRGAGDGEQGHIES